MWEMRDGSVRSFRLIFFWLLLPPVFRFRFRINRFLFACTSKNKTEYNSNVSLSIDAAFESSSIVYLQRFRLVRLEFSSSNNRRQNINDSASFSFDFCTIYRPFIEIVNYFKSKVSSSSECLTVTAAVTTQNSNGETTAYLLKAFIKIECVWMWVRMCNVQTEIFVYLIRHFYLSLQMATSHVNCEMHICNLKRHLIQTYFFKVVHFYCHRLSHAEAHTHNQTQVSCT